MSDISTLKSPSLVACDSVEMLIYAVKSLLALVDGRT